MTDSKVSAPETWVSIVHWNGGDMSMTCLESVLAEVAPERVIFVDNGSTDGIVDKIRTRWPGVCCRVNPINEGFTGGHNRAIVEAMERGAAYILLLNQDAVTHPGCIARMTALAESDSRIGLVSPVVYYADDARRVQFCGAWIDFDRLHLGGSRDPERMRSFQSSDGANVVLWGTALMLRRELVEDIGILDDRLFAYFEDTDLSVRALRAGWKPRVCFDARVDHEGHATRYTRGPHVFYLSSRNSLLFWSKALAGRGSRFRGHLKAVAKILHEAGTLNDARMPAQAQACIDGLWAGWRGRYGAYADRVEAPVWMRRWLLSHPYLWSRLFDGEWGGVLRDALSRLRGA